MSDIENTNDELSGTETSGTETSGTETSGTETSGTETSGTAFHESDTAGVHSSPLEVTDSTHTPGFYKPPVEATIDGAGFTPDSSSSHSPAAESLTARVDQPAFKKPNKALPIVAAAVIAAVIGGATGAGVTVLLTKNKAVTVTTTAPQGITINDTENVNAITAVAAKVSPSVVTIDVSDGTNAGTGSGVILSPDGYILTNNHVATLDGQVTQPTISVQDNDGRIFTATVVGTDPTVDLAVIKVDGVDNLTPIEWADSSQLNVGDVTIAMGAPLGLAGTVTTGIISALNRSIQIASSSVPDTSGQQDSNNGSNPFDFWNFDNGQGQSQSTTAASSTISIPVIQTDAAINPGNSGGPLLDSSGKLIGINVAIASAGSSSSGQTGSIGLGFALPSNLAKRVSEELIAQQKATHGLLGATISDAASKQGSTQVGAYIESVVAGGAAASGGLAVGDVITNFNGVRVSDSSDLTAQVRTAPGGSEATVTFIRDGETQTVTVTLGTV